MKRTRHKRSPSPRRRVLELIAAHPEGCTEAVLAAENVPADVLIELVQSGLVIARSEYRDDEEGAVEVTRVWITEAGKRVFVARELPEDIEELVIADDAVHLPEVIASAFGGSRSEARRAIAGGGVKLDGEPVPADVLDMPAAELDGRVLQVGKRRFRRLRVV